MPGMRPSERVPFTTIDKRPRLSMPNGERIIVWPILALEVWNIDRAMARMVISPPQGFRKHRIIQIGHGTNMGCGLDSGG